jgi:hypothetical protein
MFWFFIIIVIIFIFICIAIVNHIDNSHLNHFDKSYGYYSVCQKCGWYSDINMDSSDFWNPSCCIKCGNNDIKNTKGHVENYVFIKYKEDKNVK